MMPYNTLLKPHLGTPINHAYSLGPAGGLVLAPVMNENGGSTVFDLSGNRNTGTFGGNISWISGKFGPAIDFPNGASDYITIPYSNILAAVNDDITYSIWVSIDAFIDFDGVICQTGSDLGYQIILLAAGNGIRFRCRAGGSWKNLDSTGYSTGTLYHLVLRHDGANDELEGFVDGVSIGTVATGVINQSTGDYELGRANGNTFNGQFSHGLVYNRILSASEIALQTREPFVMFKDPNEVAILGGFVAAGVTVPVMYHHYQIAAGAA